MSNILFDLIEINIVVSIAICLLYILAGCIRKRYGAFWLKMMWLLLAVRLLIPYNFSLPDTTLRLFNAPGFEQGQTTDVFLRDMQSAFAEGVPFVKEMLPPVGKGPMEQESKTVFGTEKQPAIENSVNEEALTEENVDGSAQMNVVDENHSANTVPASDEQGSAGRQELSVQTAKTAPYRYSDIMIVVWVAGVLIFAVYYIAVYLIWAGKCKRDLHIIKDESLKADIKSLLKRYGGNQLLPVYESQMASSPMLIGLMRARLIVPAGWEKWDRKELELVIAHELCHYFQKDLWLKMVMLAACCINWFNPFLYILKKQFFYDAELVCDSIVIQDADEGKRDLYAETLLDFAGKRRKHTVFVSEFSADKKQLKDRIAHLYESPVRKKGIVVFAFVTVFVLAASVFISCGYKSTENVTHAEGKASPASGQAVDGTFLNKISHNATGDETSLGGTFIDGTSKDGASKADESEAGASKDGTSIAGAPNDFAENASGTGGQGENSPETVKRGFSYNHEYNKRVRYYGGITYISQRDGIYRVVDGADGIDGITELIFPNHYDENRGMAIYNSFLYFCGDAERESDYNEDATVYKMNLKTLETNDVLAGIDEEYGWLKCPEIDGDCLYVKRPFDRIGFRLDEHGDAVEILDVNAQDFLYHDYNEYYSLWYHLFDGTVDEGSEEWTEITSKMNEMYVPLVGIVECKRMLNGAYVVYKYKDEAMVSVYLADTDGEYIYLCDVPYADSVSVTDTGVYYKDLNGDILFTDYEARDTQRILERRPEWTTGVQLINYDEEFLYLRLDQPSNRVIQNDKTYWENSVMRVPRTGGETEEIFHAMEEYEPWAARCGLSPDYLIFLEDFKDGREKINLQLRE